MAIIKEQEVQKMMAKLDLTREEAIELIEFDAGERECEEVEELTKKAKPVAKEMTQVSRKPMEEKPKMAGVTTQTRKRKEDKPKQEIIAALKTALENLEGAESIDVTNIEKTIMFTLGDDTFEIDLKKKRQTKK